jgi:hypothetical protein
LAVRLIAPRRAGTRRAGHVSKDQRRAARACERESFTMQPCPFLRGCRVRWTYISGVITFLLDSNAASSLVRHREVEPYKLTQLRQHLRRLVRG